MWTDSDLTVDHELSLFGTKEEVDQLFNQAIDILTDSATAGLGSPLQNETVFMATLAARTLKGLRDEAAAAEAAAELFDEEEEDLLDVDEELDLAAGNSVNSTGGKPVNEATGKSVNRSAAVTEPTSLFADKSVNAPGAAHVLGKKAQPLALQRLETDNEVNGSALPEAGSFSPSPLTSEVADEAREAPSTNSSSWRFKHVADEGKSEGLVQRSRPPRWRDLGPISSVLALNDGLALRHPGRSAVTINLGRDIEAKLKTKDNPAGWFAKRVSLELKPIEKMLGRELGFWLVLESWTRTGSRPHFHGVVSCSSEERPAVEHALRRAAGRWDSRRGEEHQIDWSEWDGPPDDGWADYVLKNINRTRRSYPGVRIFAADQQTHDAARAVFETWRAQQLRLPAADAGGLRA